MYITDGGRVVHKDRIPTTWNPEETRLINLFLYLAEWPQRSREQVELESLMEQRLREMNQNP